MATAHHFYSKKLPPLFYITVIFLLVIAGFSLKAAWGGYQKYSESKGNLDRVSGQWQTLSAREKELQVKLQALQTQKGVEAEILDRFNVAKSGEGVAIIVGGSQNQDASATALEKKSFLGRVLDFLWFWK
jgi:hypothetical protein